MVHQPFEEIESAHGYITLLAEQVRRVKDEIAEERGVAVRAGESRRVDVWRLVDYKLTQLAMQLTSSARVLNDLRTLRRLLQGERDGASDAADNSRLSEATVEKTCVGET
jgi:hypothetical protein